MKSLDSDETTQLLLAESHAAFAPPHFLLFTRRRTLVAQRFDVSTLKLVGEPSPIVDDVLLTAQGRAAFAVSDAGVLAYRTGEATRSLVWVDRSGKVSDPIGALNANTEIRLSHDGTRVVFHQPTGDGADDVYIYDIGQKVTSQLTKHPDTDHFAIWSPDGAYVAYHGFRATRTRESTKCGLMGRRPSESLSRRTLTLGLTLLRAIGDATLLCSDGIRNRHRLGPVGAPTIGRPKAVPLSASFFVSSGPAVLSPNGRWLAYSANEGGVDQVIVQSFPDPLQGRRPDFLQGRVQSTLE